MAAQPAFVPLAEFWSNFFEMSARNGPPPCEDASLKRYFGGVFGELTTHRFERLGPLPVSIRCGGCHNNTPDRKNAVCNTHLGVLKGVFQAMTHVPLDARFHARPGGDCHIMLELASGPDGRKPVAHAARLAHAVLVAQPGQVLLTDARNGAQHTLTPAAAAVLAALDDERTVADIAASTRLPVAEVQAILDQCYSVGWISCRFDIAAQDG